MSGRVQQLMWCLAVLAASSGLAACSDHHHHKKTTATPTGAATATRTATRSSTATATALSSATATGTSTALRTATPTSTGSPTPTATPSPTGTPDQNCPISADTQLGTVCGTTGAVSGLTSRAFLGIPYAEDPSGDNRWTAPIAVTARPDKFQATQYGAICPQAGQPAMVPTPSEDCLSVNVWTPPGRGQALLPVMVFIHGGAFIEGNSAFPQYDGTYMAASQNVVVASFNYRLGALGFLAGIDGLTGNYGFLDQQLALQWVKDNIEGFGGDPSQITIFGESAGAMSVGLHLLSAPGSADLFDADIMESNPFALPYKTVEQSAPFGTLLAGLLKCEPSDLACLRATSWQDVVAAQDDKSIVIPGLLSGFGGLLVWAPVVDGTVLTEQPLAAAKSDGLGKPTLLGTNRNEGTVFVYLALEVLKLDTLTPADYTGLVAALFGGTAAAEILKIYPPEADSAPVAAQLSTDYIFFCATRALAETGDESTFAYEFNQLTSFNTYPPVPQCADHVCHGAELPYVFNTATVSGDMFTADEEALSKTMVGYWGSFGHPDHTPNGDARPTWPAFPGKNYQLLDTPISTAVDPPHHCDFWDTVGYDTIGISALLPATAE